CLLLDLGITMRGMEAWTGAGWTPGSVMVWLLRGLRQREVLKVIAAFEDEVGVDARVAQSLLPMTWDMLAEMQRAGVVIGSHSRTHAWLTMEARERAVDEIRGSRATLESQLGVPARHFAYPDGHFNAETASLVAAAGYRFGYTTCRDQDPGHPLLTISRRMLWQNACVDRGGRLAPAVLSCHLHGVLGLARRCELHH